MFRFKDMKEGKQKPYTYSASSNQICMKENMKKKTCLNVFQNIYF